MKSPFRVEQSSKRISSPSRSPSAPSRRFGPVGAISAIDVSLEDGQLLTKRGIFQCDLFVAGKHKNDESNSQQNYVQHEAMTVARSAGTINQLLTHDVLANDTWFGLKPNPAHGVVIGKIKPVRQKWALTPAQACALLAQLKLKARTMVAVDLTTGLRRGGLEALQWENLNDKKGELRIEQHHYPRHLCETKTEAGKRMAIIPAE